MHKKTALLTFITVLLGACAASSYDFRDGNRPEFEEAISVHELNNVAKKEAVTILDVRLLEDYQANEVLIPGASYVNPDNIERWASSIPDDAKVVVYCVKGKWVSHKAASYLAAKGIDAYILDGGIEAWQQANYATE